MYIVRTYMYNMHGENGNTKSHSRKSHPGKLTPENSLPKFTPENLLLRKPTPENPLPKTHSREFHSQSLWVKAEGLTG
jgi:hypothetical protein